MLDMEEEKMLVYGRKKEDLLTCTLSDETNELLSALDMMPSFIGNIVDFELNKILRECEAIIFKSAGLYEEGYFDCAFYLLRQVWELIENMLLMSYDRKKLADWNKGTGKFDLLATKKELTRVSTAYQQMKEKLGGFFGQLKSDRDRAQKIVHKQGFNTFYTFRRYPANFPSDKQKEEREFFESFLKKNVGLFILFYIAVEPLSLATADKKLSLKIHENFATGSIDVDLAKKCLGDKEFNTIKKLDIYKDTFETFNARAPVNSYTLCVTQENFFPMEQLDSIWKDKVVLCGCAFQILRILKSGIVARKFMSYSFDSFYYTSIIPENKRFDLCVSSDFEPYISIVDNYNISHGKRYVSKVILYNEVWLIEHDNILHKEQIEFLNSIGTESQENIFEKQHDRALTKEEKDYMKTILEMIELPN